MSGYILPRRRRSPRRHLWRQLLTHPDSADMRPSPELGRWRRCRIRRPMTTWPQRSIFLGWTVCPRRCWTNRCWLMLWLRTALSSVRCQHSSWRRSRNYRYLNGGKKWSQSSHGSNGLRGFDLSSGSGARFLFFQGRERREPEGVRCVDSSRE